MFTIKVIEYNALKSITFVAEAYLFHINLLDQLEEVSASSENGGDKEGHPTAGPSLQFYQRSKSLCYPYISAAEDHHAFKYSANDCLPLSTRPQLLQSSAGKDSLFSLPLPQRTKAAHIV